MKSRKYILVTAAYNEEKKIDNTIQSVLSQTILPLKWIIISDGSTDNTENIINSYKKKHAFIEFIKIKRKENHSFGAKVNAINTGMQKISGKNYSYNYIGILDADVSFNKTYYEQIIMRFEQDKSLGVAGGDIIEFVDGKYNRRIKTYNSVAGAVQLFRRSCFEQTDGFKPMEYGGEDAAVEIAARMNGWTVQTFPEIEVIHHGYVGGGSGDKLKYRYRRGICFFYLGYHPLFQLVRCIFRFKEKPIFIGSLYELAGYFIKTISLEKPQVSPELVQFLRNEQKDRLKRYFVFK